MNEYLKQILEDLKYDKVFINTIDKIDNKYLNEYKNWKFSKVYSFEKNKIIDIITFESIGAFNEQIVDSLMNIRKRCISKYGYDIVPLDIDMCGCYFGYGNSLDSNIPKKYINILRHKFKKLKINPQYLLANQPKHISNKALVPLIKNEIYHGLTKKQINGLKNINRYLYKRYKIDFECWTYYIIK